MGDDGTCVCPDYDAVRVFPGINTNGLSDCGFIDKYDHTVMDMYAMIIAFAQKYDKKMGLGTLISVMFPYSMFFLVSWTFVLIVWLMFGIDLGPGSPINY